MKSRQQTSRLSQTIQPPHFTSPRVRGCEAVPVHEQHPRVQTAFQATVASLEISTIPCTACRLKHVSRHRCSCRPLLGTVAPSHNKRTMGPPRQKRTRNSTSSRASANLHKTEVTINVYDLLPVSLIRAILRIHLLEGNQRTKIFIINHNITLSCFESEPQGCSDQINTDLTTSLQPSPQFSGQSAPRCITPASPSHRQTKNRLSTRTADILTRTKQASTTRLH